MIRIAVVEDEDAAAGELLRFLDEYGRSRGEALKTVRYADGDDLVSHYGEGFDIILMDIELPLLDGMTAAELIRDRDQEVIIIFITNMAQYAIRGYAVDAMDFLLKPVNPFALAQRLNRALERKKSREKRFLTILSEGAVQKLDISHISFVESQGRILTFHYEGGTISSYGTIRELEEKLRPQYFFRCNRSFLINLEHVEQVYENTAVVAGQQVLVSRQKKAALIEALSDYVGDTMK